jgi:hypothetical protein
MENMPTREPFGAHSFSHWSRWTAWSSIISSIVTSIWQFPCRHLFSAYNTSVLSSNFRRSRIGISVIHISRGIPIANEIGDSFEKGPDGQENVAHYMNWQAIESKKNKEEREIDHKFKEV